MKCFKISGRASGDYIAPKTSTKILWPNNCSHTSCCDVEYEDSHNFTTSCFAARNGHLQVLIPLHQAGADINKCKKGNGVNSFDQLHE